MIFIINPFLSLALIGPQWRSGGHLKLFKLMKIFSGVGNSFWLIGCYLQANKKSATSTPNFSNQSLIVSKTCKFCERRWKSVVGSFTKFFFPLQDHFSQGLLSSFLSHTFLFIFSWMRGLDTSAMSGSAWKTTLLPKATLALPFPKKIQTPYLTKTKMFQLELWRLTF